jgi:hypothetical protein
MSRLDDELKVAFQRQEPSADFAARVLARINDAPAPRPQPTAWQRLAGLFAMPTLRYAAVGAMALLLIIIGIALLRPPRPAGVDSTPQVAGSSDSQASPAPGAGPTASEQNGASSNAKANASGGGTSAPASSATAQNHAASSPRTINERRQIHHHAPVVAQQLPPSAAAEAAKEKVLFALQITSETLNDAQRAIADDSSKDEKPEPVQNR